jgi:hypothetical protein
MCHFLQLLPHKTICMRSLGTVRSAKGDYALSRRAGTKLICYNLHDSLNISTPKTVTGRKPGGQK